MKTALRFLVSAGIAATAFLNLWYLNQSFYWVTSRTTDPVVVVEDRIRSVRDALMKSGYRRGDIGYMPAGVLLGKPRTASDDQQWARIRYAMIPWNLLQDNLKPSYVLLDATRIDSAVDIPQGFTKMYDSKDGLILLKKPAAQ